MVQVELNNMCVCVCMYIYIYIYIEVQIATVKNYEQKKHLDFR